MIAMLSFSLGDVYPLPPSTYRGITVNPTVAAAALPMNRRLDIFTFFDLLIL